MTDAIVPHVPPVDPALRQRDYLLRAAQALTADLDLPTVLARVIRTAVGMTGGEAGAIALRQADGEMRVVASFRLEERFEHFLDPLLDPSPAVDETGAADGPIPGFSGEPALAPLTRANPTGGGPQQAESAIPQQAAGLVVYDVAGGPDGSRQVLALPLQVDDTPLGRIFVFRSEGATAFTPLDGNLLQVFADQAALAIQNAETHRRLRARERRLTALVEHSPAGSLLLDVAERVVSFNPAAVTLTGRPEAALAGSDIHALLDLEDERGGAVRLAMPDGEATATVQGYLRRPAGGHGPYVQVALTPLAGPRGDRVGFVVDLVDLSGYKAAEDAKRAFLAGLSHELKTPLALIRGFAETLRFPKVRGDEALADEALDVILDETAHLNRMVEQLLLAARLQAGALTLNWHVIDVATELGRTVEAFRLTQPDRVWTADIPADLPAIVADPVRLREVFENLLANAVKYSDPGTPIEVRAAAAEGGSALRIAVRDAGIGIAPADQPRVFERFVRATDRGDGTGLGLYMSRAIVEAHGGRIEVDSAPGRGSTFTVTLPCDPPGAELARTWDVRGEADLRGGANALGEADALGGADVAVGGEAAS